MNKLLLVDGNNFMFRSYYATAYSGNIMKNSKGMPTNALYGFTSMINKIINEEKPTYMVVAFDIGKNFRKQKYDFYKEGRTSTPDELKIQMPYARKILDAMGIKHLELEPYEADDIIGTIVKMAENDPDFDCTIISSDKDLLQLINEETDVKLLKQSGFIRYSKNSFYDEFKIDPIKIIDLKALMGDNSDNIPGVKGIGEKTALKLLQEYQSLENIYANINNIKGSVHEKLVNDEKSAYMSKEIATIYQEVPLGVNLTDLKYLGTDDGLANAIFSELEFSSFLKNNHENDLNDISYIDVNEDINVILEKEVAFYLHYNSNIYTNADVTGASVYDGKNAYFFDKKHLNLLPNILKDKIVTTYDHKKNLYLFNDLPCTNDIMICAYLLEYNLKDDISSCMLSLGYNILDNNKINELDSLCFAKELVKIAKILFDNKNSLLKKLDDKGLIKLYNEIEMPLINVLSKMERQGIKVSKDELIKQGNQIDEGINQLTKEIYELASKKFNILSPKQLGEILFDKLKIDTGKKNKTGYKTDADTLEKLRDKHPIINKILEYRNLSKIKSTYIDGLLNYLDDEQKIHTIFKQTITRTGRLSSAEPNLQNIPVREELGRCIRKAFLPSNNIFLSSDYSQIELRILAHISKCPKMIDAFNSNEDIHKKVAADINGVDLNDVTKEMRAKAKSVIFGIVYGISGYGLMENLHINKNEAEYFINKYYDMYPEVKAYMDNTKKSAEENGYVKTLFGRIRTIDELKSNNFMVRQMGQRMAINTPIQGTAADIMKLAMINIDKEFAKQNIRSKMILQVHDELIFDVVEEETELITKIVKNIMENVIKLDVPLIVSSDTGTNWYETK